LGLAGEILDNLDAVVESDDRDLSVLTGYQIVQHGADALNLGENIFQIGAALHGDDQRQGLVAHIGVDPLELIVVVQLKILELEAVDEVSAPVANGGGGDNDVDADSSYDGVGVLSGEFAGGGA